MQVYCILFRRKFFQKTMCFTWSPASHVGDGLCEKGHVTHGSICAMSLLAQCIAMLCSCIKVVTCDIIARATGKMTSSLLDTPDWNRKHSDGFGEERTQSHSGILAEYNHKTTGP